MKKILFLLIFTLFCFANEIKSIDLTKFEWQYKWGDSPFENNFPLWTNDKENDSSWQKIDFPSNPENRNNQTNVWYRVKLPDALPNDPNLYIVSIDLITQVYFENRQIYHFGEFNKEGKGEYKGWPWHLIKLPNDSAGKYLYFRITTLSPGCEPCAKEMFSAPTGCKSPNFSAHSIAVKRFSSPASFKASRTAPSFPTSSPSRR